MEKKIEKLNPESVFEFTVAGKLKELMDDSDCFYHIEVRDDNLSIEKQGYNTPGLGSVTFDMSQLVENELFNQKLDAIRTAYTYTFSKTGDLQKRVDDVISHSTYGGETPSAHAFYHDRTGKYSEDKIVSLVKASNPDLFKENSKGISR
ncbi:MAG: hypothetical protein IKF19_05300 [Bacilli bacterium]|nr:hypothetical protein [Bacilli bacterium]